jgi:sirohydrochlorin ferrochelatase
LEYENCGRGVSDAEYRGGTQALSDAQEKNECVLPLFIFSGIGRITMSLYTAHHF